MKILVCISNVPDTTTKIKFVNNNTTFDSQGVQWIINPWDELALTRALELKESSNGSITEVCVINVGLKDSEPTIRKALAIGADKAFRINAEPKDGFLVASYLAEAIKKEPYDIIMCGIESSDFNGSVVGGMLAEILDIPSISSVSGLNIINNEINVDREIDGGKETLAATLPLLVIVQKGITKEPRIPSMRGIMSARTKPLVTIEPTVVEPLVGFESYSLPKPKAACKMISAENPKELIELLHNEAKII
jgi:electron transfer flavoprotein beta subunit